MARANSISSLVGGKFGNLLVISEAAKGLWRSKSLHYVCLCDCGVSTIVASNYLRYTKIQSCGCIRAKVMGKLASERFKGKAVTHGATILGASKKTNGAYNSWIAMRRRCLDVSFKDYPRYGAKGITVCKEWLDSFEQFYADMGDRPEGMTIDRIEGAKVYSKETCRWATHLTQMNNVSTNRILEFNGEKHTVSEWSNIVSISRACISARINKLGWSIERALTEKPNGKNFKN